MLLAVKLVLSAEGKFAYKVPCPVKTFASESKDCRWMIGRDPDKNDWVLPDTSGFLSRMHCLIEYSDGHYFLIDTSANGTYLNGALAPLGRGNRVMLQEGDLIQMGDFEFKVTLIQEAPVNHQPQSSALVQETVDPLDILGIAQSGADAVSTKQGEAAGQCLTGDLPSIDIPENWGEIKTCAVHDDNVAAATTPEPFEQKETNPEEGFTEFLRMMGLEPTQPAPSPQLLGLVFREMTDELIQALSDRNQFRNQFRLSMTTVQRYDNNPLKFAPNVREAFSKLFNQSAQEGYLDALTAYREAFADLHAHQDVLMISMKAAFRAMLAAFDPETLATQLELRTAQGWRSLIKKESAWERYSEYYASLVQNPERCFTQLFGETFSKVYEEQIAQHKQAHIKATAEGREFEGV